MVGMPIWSPRVDRGKIRLLYQQDSMGLIDQDLLEDVSFAIHMRCISILEVTEAVRGKAHCPACRTVIRHSAKADAVLRCSTCHWEMAWSDYRKSYKGKKLFGGGAVQAFDDYARDFPNAVTIQDKMILIDKLLHECHKFPTPAEKIQLHTRPAAINLIEGDIDDIIELLEGLAYGSESVPGAMERLAEWRMKVMSASRMGYGRLDE